MEPGFRDTFTFMGVQTFPDGNRYLILEDAQGYRFFQDYKPYANYGLKAGTKITCRVDKINCNGKIFLEPAHPWFEEGNFYDIPIILRKYLTAFTLLIGVDPGGSPHVIFSTNAPHSSTITVQIISISKGKVNMEPADLAHRTPLPESQKLLETLWEECVSDEIFGSSLAILSRGPMPLVAPLRCMPESYNPGDKVNCFSKTGIRWVEPVDPIYTQNQLIRLFYVESITKPDLLRGPKTFILATDETGKKHEILVSAAQLNTLRTGDPLLAIIKSYRCGKPILEWVFTDNSQTHFK
ncbi:MAG: hypothetical protein ACP5O2_08520 [Bacteroidales bacterium]